MYLPNDNLLAYFKLSLLAWFNGIAITTIGKSPKKISTGFFVFNKDKNVD